MQSSHERRRAPRVTVELAGELHLPGHPPAQGLVHDISRGGALFVPRGHFTASVGHHGRLLINLSDGALELPVRVARVADVQLSSIPSVRGFGVEFDDLKRDQERALAALLAQREATT